MNPYKIGLELFREIEDRWNKGKFGKDYDECDDLEARRRWDRKLGLGRQKIFEVRKIDLPRHHAAFHLYRRFPGRDGAGV